MDAPRDYSNDRVVPGGFVVSKLGRHDQESWSGWNKKNIKNVLLSEENKQETDGEHQSPAIFTIMLQWLFLSNFTCVLHHIYTTMVWSPVELHGDS